MQTSAINIACEIERLLAFGLRQQLLETPDVIPARNSLLDLFRIDEPCAYASAEPAPDTAVPILERMLDYAAAAGLLPENSAVYRDLFDARIMGLIMPRASETARTFRALAAADPEAATDFFYKQSSACNYIRTERIKRNAYWLADTAYGAIEITVNLSKPEIDPKTIALMRSAPASSYPKCLLCADNAGYAGRVNHPARQNHHIIPLKLDGQAWYFQYSPYLYYNEHSIVFCAEHVPMQLTESTFRRLLDFVRQFPHYFIGSNADLPIVGGSILSHDHFQAGRHTFPMERAPIEAEYAHPSLSGLSAGIVRWPMSVIRLRCAQPEPLIETAAHILAKWRAYSDAAVDIAAYSDAGEGQRTPHNTITPIARRHASGLWELDLVLRNNRTTAEHPDGLFHPHARLHHIKKENIGLIEVMGLAVLPGRLQQELSGIAALLCGQSAYDPQEIGDSAHPLRQHADWIAALIERHGAALSGQEASELLQRSVGEKFVEVLTDAGVFKRTPAGSAGFDAFMRHVGFEISNS